MLLNKTAVITGCNRGIGQAVLEAFCENGANVVAHARTETPEFNRLCAGLSEGFNVEVTPVYFDLTDFELSKAKLKEIIKLKNSIDILVNNAGIAHGGLFQMTPLEQIKKVFDVNFFALINVSQVISRKMLRQKSGRIINIASVSGIDLKAGNCAYGTSKAAVIALTKTLSAELSPQGILVNAVAPGLTDTDMSRLVERKAGEHLLSGTALKRLAKPQEIAKTVVFLASEQSSFITGETIVADGGRV